MAKILVISPTPSHPQDAGNRARIFSLYSELQRWGHTIHFLFLDKAVEKSDGQAMERQWDSFWCIAWRQPKVPWRKRWFDSLTRILKSNRVLPYKIDDWFDNSIIPAVQNISITLNPDIVMVEYAYISKILSLFDSNILKILDTHDVFGCRDQLFYQINKKPIWFYTSETEEKKGVNRADIILAIQASEAEYFKKLSGKKVLTVGHLVKSIELGDAKPTFPPRLLFVGSSNPSNLDGIKWFLENVFEILQEKIPDIQLDIVGSASDYTQPGKNLNLLGTIEDLTPYYNNASVVINPLRLGTGLKIKSLEALSMKRPLITTPNGASGIEEWAEHAFLCADTADEFAAAILKVITSTELQESLTKGAEEFINDYNKKVFSSLKEEINSFLVKKNAFESTEIF